MLAWCGLLGFSGDVSHALSVPTDFWSQILSELALKAKDEIKIAPKVPVYCGFFLLMQLCRCSGSLSWAGGWSWP
jgi:hypothetical protein